jgi:hypothetical protein
MKLQYRRFLSGWSTERALIKVEKAFNLQPEYGSARKEQAMEPWL